MARLRLISLLTIAVMSPSVVRAQVEINQNADTTSADIQSSQPRRPNTRVRAIGTSIRTRRALIVCGLPGDEEYLESFTRSVRLIKEALVERFGFREANVRIQFGRPEEVAEPEELATDGRATTQEIADEAATLVRQTSDQDLAWVFVIGHSYFDGKTVHLNIPDTDISHRQFAKLFAGLNGKQVTFFICTPVSGFYIRELSRSNRVVITSTEADAETNASLFHSVLSETLREIEPNATFDLDKNGAVSLLDLYLKSNQKLADVYLSNDPPLIATEHPQLDDNGDGRGSELQIDYLTTEQGGRSDSKRRRRFRTFEDGGVAGATTLPFATRESD